MTRAKAYRYLRFSSPQQAKGDSYRRQTDLVNDFVSRHGLDLDEGLSATFEDLGIPSFRGQNLEHGLGEVIEAIKKGRIARGSFLLVESLDRLSRQAVRKALQLFLEILNAGINIATLSPEERVYYADKVDHLDILISLTVFARGFEESATKAKRIAATWEKKRNALATGTKATSRCPEWLTLDKDKNEFNVIAARAEVVKQIRCALRTIARKQPLKV